MLNSYVAINTTSEDAIFLISPLSQPPNDYRGIFDLCIPQGSVTLDVFINEEELNRHKEVKEVKVFLFKDRVWVVAPSQEPLTELKQEFGEWKGVIQVTFSPGDPPIAVG